ncbi:Mucosa-associated lymphoid tissue lymphoma translocation protein 1 [Geodia barretti]|uniref:Mucosa-associated lymphoid tissue lymphoma translocation protein 1 n=1 Tax=Geodia barretti TaxID=519541 RepID=A0AA35RNR8_GEOBA|nr:Mucosa-associated lymphoid tissue lymphoma translocation protein 1 [Geodia barretti]
MYPCSIYTLSPSPAINGATESVFCTKSSGRFYCQVGLREHPEQLPMLSSTTRVSINTIKITAQPRDVHGQTGECVSLYCRADFIQPVSSKEKIGYMWLMSSTKDGKKEPLQKALQPQQSEGTLLFEQLNINHRGYYVCQACFENEFVESVEVHLSVTMAGGEPLPTTGDHTKTPSVVGGETKGRVQDECSAKVTPDQPLQYQWMKDNKPIPNATAPELIEYVNQTVINALIMKSNPESGGGSATYQCEVSAGGGVQVHSLSAYTHEPAPDPPPAKGHHNHQQAEAEEMLSTLSGQRYARDKVALLIGNQRYSGCDKLNNLKCIEQEVFVFVNLKLLEMKQVLDWFYSLLSPGVYGLFYYSGHGFHVGSTSYLMPVDRQASDPDTNSCIGTNSISHDMQKTLCRAVLVLDCCRVIQEDTSQQATTPYPSLGTATIVEIHSTLVLSTLTQ